MPHTRQPLTKPKIVLCEGRSDASFLRALLTSRGTSEAEVCSIEALTDGHYKGKSNFHEALRVIRQELRGRLQRVIIIGDADDDATLAFTEIQAQLSQLLVGAPSIERKYAVPDAPGVLKSSEIAVGIIIIPVGQSSGCLEDVLYPVACSVSSAKVAAIDVLAGATGVSAWNPRSQLKSKLRCLLACSHEPQPEISLGNLWIDNRGGRTLIPIDDSRFDATSNAIQALLM